MISNFRKYDIRIGWIKTELKSMSFSFFCCFEDKEIGNSMTEKPLIFSCSKDKLLKNAMHDSCAEKYKRLQIILTCK